MGVGGLCPKRASAQIRCKCTKKTARRMFRPHFLKLCFAHLRFTPISFPTTRENLPSFFENAEPPHTTSQPATPPSPTASSPVRPPRRFRTRRTCDGEDTLARNAHNAHNSRFSFFAFTPSRTHHKQLIHRLLSVKTFISDTFTRLHPLFAPSSAHAGTSHRAPMGHRTDKRRR